MTKLNLNCVGSSTYVPTTGSCVSKCNDCTTCDCASGPRGPAGSQGAKGVSGRRGTKFVCVAELIMGSVGDICDAPGSTASPALIDGDIFVDENTGIVYVWNGTAWAVSSEEVPFYILADVEGCFKVFFVSGAECPYDVHDISEDCEEGDKLLDCTTNQLWELDGEGCWASECEFGGATGPAGPAGPAGPQGLAGVCPELLGITSIELVTSEAGTVLQITDDGSPPNVYQTADLTAL